MRRGLAVICMLLALTACIGGGKPPVVNPTPPATPSPEPTATPTPVPTPTPTPPPVVVPCESVDDFRMDLRKPPVVARYIVSATPGHNLTTSGSFRPMGPECNPVLEDCSQSRRQICEDAGGPYLWSLNGVDCNLKSCANPEGNCFPLNDNPLMYVVCVDDVRPGGMLRVEAASTHAHAEILVTR